MAEHDPGSPRDPVEERLLRRLRLIAVVVILAMIVLLIVGDTLGRLYIDPSFHSSEVALGTMVGALIVLLGLEGVARFPGRSK
jgi:uncharacterized BrkB/YihY/UPF0761 family membrane protein